MAGIIDTSILSSHLPQSSSPSTSGPSEKGNDSDGDVLYFYADKSASCEVSMKDVQKTPAEKKEEAKQPLPCTESEGSGNDCGNPGHRPTGRRWSTGGAGYGLERSIVTRGSAAAAAAAAAAALSRVSLEAVAEKEPENEKGKKEEAEKDTAKEEAMEVEPRYKQEPQTEETPAPSTPVGRVVESGQEHIGRWTREEHEAFLEALQKYGKEWKKVAAKVKTRTVVQTRTHAQKYFQKIQKMMAASGGSGGATSAADLAVLNLVGGVKMEGGSDDSSEGIASSVKKRGRRASTGNAALSNANLLPLTTPSPAKTRPRAPPKPSRLQVINDLTELYHEEACADTKAAAELMAQMSTAPVVHHLGATSSIPSTAPLHTARPASDSSVSLTCHESPSLQTHPYYQEPTTTFPTVKPIIDPVKQSQPQQPPSFTTMKIIAPSQEHVRQAGFPEPSPAACGKRKLAEIAAAQMLAGVAATQQLKKEPKLTVIPPPTKKISLQIVNPDSLGVVVPKKDRRRGPNSSPSTPWDGQLEALVSNEVKTADSSVKNPQDQNDDADSQSSLTAKQPPHPISGPRKYRTPLHEAVYTSNVDNLKSILYSNNTAQTSASDLVSEVDSLGFTALHVAASLHDKNIAAEMTRLLLSSGADATATDSTGNTALHWAARCGNENVVHLLSLRNCPLDALNQDGETALHWAMRSGRKALPTVRVLIEDGARPFIFNKAYRRPIDLAASGFSTEETINVQEAKETRSNLLSCSPQSRTLVLHHPECLEHIPKTNRDWEVPDRILSIIKRISPSDEMDEKERICFHAREITLSTDFDRASLELLSRVHSTEYLACVNELSKELERKKKMQHAAEGGGDHHVIPFTPMVQRKVHKEENVKHGTNSDTSFSAGSLKAARRAAGAVQHAVDCVLMGRNRNAFCAIRPPGHHAGVDGLLQNSESCGFCIFNNVAAGAMHALSDRHRPRCERCAIVDIDVHHGNGTQEIVQRYKDPSRLLFFSVHLFDREPVQEKKRSGSYMPCEDCDSYAWKFYPGTGDADDVALNVINVPIAPLWKEKEVLQSISHHKTLTNSPNHHNTRTKHKLKIAKASTKPTESDVSSQTSQNESQEQHQQQPSGSKTCSTPLPSAPSSPATPSQLYLMGVGRKAYRRAIQHRLLPALRAFNPDLILISAGFDAARGDVGNAKHMEGKQEKMGIDLEPDDYAWTTQRIMEVADICCQGRVISVLEGGYGRFPQSQEENYEENFLLDKNVFSECAARHLWALVDPYNTEMRI